MKLEDNRTIAGTPLGSGVWQANIMLEGLRCEGRDGKVKTYADKTLNVKVSIQ